MLWPVVVEGDFPHSPFIETSMLQLKSEGRVIWPRAEGRVMWPRAEGRVMWLRAEGRVLRSFAEALLVPDPM